MRRFPIERKFKDIFAIVGIPVNEALAQAGLKAGLLDAPNPVVTMEEYFNFMRAIESYHLPDELVLKYTTAEQMETFSPPVFAAYCSKNAMSYLKRMAEYEALFCGIEFKLFDNGDTFILDIDSIQPEQKVPRLFILIKMIYVLHLIRKATATTVIPLNITSCYPMDNKEISEFFGTKVQAGDRNQIVFQKQDMLLAFRSENESMWSYLEPELIRRKQELDVDDSFSAEIRNCLVELLAAGECSVSVVAQKLGISVRTLQRKLQNEGTNFQQQLNHTRELLAKNYLNNYHLSIEEIAFLLGYQDVSSFQRAFTLWMGMSVSEYRKEK